MPLVSCPACATQLKIPDGMEGKKARCTKCQTIFSIPGHPAVASAPAASMPPASMPPAPMPSAPLPAAAPRPPAPPQMAAGRPPAPPPRTGTSATVPPPRPNQIAANGGPPAARPPQRPGMAPPPSAARRPASPPRKKGSPVVLFSIIGAAVVLIAGLSVGAYFLFFSRSGGNFAADKNYLPDNPDVVVSVRLADTLNSAAFQKLRSQLPALDMAMKNTDKVKEEMGVALEDIDSLLFALAANAQEKKPQGSMVMRTKSDVNAEKIVEALSKKGKTSTTTEGAHTIHSFDQGKNALCVVNNRLVVFADSTEVLQKILKRNSAPSFAPELKSALDGANFSSSVVIAAHGKNAKQALPGGMPAGGGGPGDGMDKFVPQYGTIEINIAAKIDVKVNANFNDAATASEAEKLINGSLAAVKMMDQLPQPAKDLLGGLQISVNGARLSAQSSIEPDTLVALAKLAEKGAGGLNVPPDLLALMGGGGNPGPGPGGIKNPPKNLSVNQSINCQIEPGQTQSILALCKTSAEYKFQVEAKGNSFLVVDVTANGQPVNTKNEDTNGLHTRTWPAVAEQTYMIQVVNTDTKPANCMVQLTSSGKPDDKTPQPGKTDVVKENGPFEHKRMYDPGDKVTYHFPVEAGKPASFIIIAPGSAKLDIKVTQDGAPVAQDSGLKDNFKLTWNPAKGGQAIAEVVSTDNISVPCTIEFKQGGGSTPPMDGVIVKKDSSFTESRTLKPGEKATYLLAVKPGKKLSFQVKLRQPGAVDLRVKHLLNGGLVNEDKGRKSEFNLAWIPNPEVTSVEIEVQSTDTEQDAPCIITYNQDAAASEPKLAPAIVVQRTGPFTNDEWLAPPKGNDLRYAFPVKANLPALFDLTAEPAAVLTVEILQNGKKVADDNIGIGGKKNFYKVKWVPEADGEVNVKVVNVNETPATTWKVSFSQDASAAPGAEEVVKKNGPFTGDVRQATKKDGTLTYEIPVRAGQPATFDLNANPSAVLRVIVTQDGKEVAKDDIGGNKNFYKLNWTPTSTSTAVVKVVNVNATPGTTWTVSFAQGGALPPVGGLQKDVPFNENKTIKPGDKFTYDVMLQPGKQYALNIKPKADAKLVIKVTQNGVPLALDQGLKTNFNLNVAATAAGPAQIEIVSTDNLTNDCTISFTESAGGPAPPGVIAKNGPFNELKEIKPGDNFTYQVPVQAGQAYTFLVKPQIDAQLNIKVTQNGLQLAQDVGGGVRKDFTVAFTPQAAGTVQIQVTSTDNLSNNCTLALTQGGAPVLPGGAVLAVPSANKGAVPAGGFSMHEVNFQAGGTYTIRCQSVGGFDPVIELFSPTGALLKADDDGDGFPNAKITHTANAAGIYKIKVRGFGNSGGNYNLLLSGPPAGGPPPAAGAKITPPFNEDKNIKPGETIVYKFTAKTNQSYSLRVKPKIDAKLDIKVTQGIAAPMVLAQDSGLKNSFGLAFTSSKTITTTITITSTDNLANDCTISLIEGGAVPPPPVGAGVDYEKKGGKLAKGSKGFTHTHLLQAGVAYKIEGTAVGFFLRLELKDGGKILQQQSFPTGSGALMFTPTETKNYQITIRDVFNDAAGTYTLKISH